MPRSHPDNSAELSFWLPPAICPRGRRNSANKQLNLGADVSPDGKTILLTSTRKGGYLKLALLDVATKQLQRVTDTQWEVIRFQ